MITILFSTIKDRLALVTAYLTGSVLFMWMYIALFPYIRDQAKVLSQMVEAYPQGIMEAFGVSDIELAFSKLESYLSTEMFSFIFPIILVALGVGFATSSIASEIEKGTIELLLSQPISRFQLFMGKYMAALIAFIGYTVLLILSAIPLAIIYKIDYEIDHFFKFVLVALFFGWAIISLAFLMSSIFSERGKPAFIVVGIVILTYVFNILATLKPSLEKLKNYSFFYYYDPAKNLGQGDLDLSSIWILFGFSIICTLLAICWFTRRNITTA